MHRFFVTEDRIINNEITLTAEESAHAVRVLRLKCGDSILICDGHGVEYNAEIISDDRQEVKAKIVNRCESDSESLYRITLFQCLPKGSKLETVIQKCVELGVYAIAPVVSKRCVVKLKDEKTSKKTERYNRIAFEAAKQSGRGIVPEVYEPQSLSDVDFSKFNHIVLPYECAMDLTIKKYCESVNWLTDSSASTDIAVIIGPEGGFEPDEVEALKAKGASVVTLGKRILRTETAGMATIAMLMCMLEG